MFSRSSSSSMTRWTYGLYLAFTAAFWALAALLFAAIPPSRGRSCGLNGGAYPAPAAGNASSPARPRAAAQGGREDLLDLLDPRELQVGEQVIGEVLDVGLVAARGDDAGDAG